MFKNNKKTMKTIVFSLELAALMLTVNDLSAQDRGLFNMGKSSTDSKIVGNNGGLLRGDVTINDDEGGISNYGIGEPVPVGSGIAILLAAGMGYVTLKKKEDEQ